MKYRLIFTLLVIVYTPQISKAEESYREFVQASMAGDHEQALRIGAGLVKGTSVITPETVYLEDGMEALLFDISHILIKLKRWEEARYCLGRFLIEVQPERELLKTFGLNFSKEKWLNENKLSAQPWFATEVEAI